MKRGIIIASIVLAILVIALGAYFVVYKKTNASSSDNSATENSTEKQNTSLENSNESTSDSGSSNSLGEFQLDFANKVARTPYERLFIGEKADEETMNKFLASINNTRNDLRSFIQNINDSEMELEVEQEDSIGLNSINFPLVKDSDIKALSFDVEISSGAISVTPILDYIGSGINNSEGEKISISSETSSKVALVKITWNNFENGTDEVNNAVNSKKNITISLDTEYEKSGPQFGIYYAEIKIELYNTSTSGNSSSAKLRVYAEGGEELRMPQGEIVINEYNINESLDNDEPILFLDAGWIIKRIDKSCKGIIFPGVNKIGISSYNPSKLEKAVSDKEYANKEGMSCPLKEFEEEDRDDPSVMFVLVD